MFCIWIVETSTKTGEQGNIVEIDESALGCLKHNTNGYLTKTRCVVSGLERNTKKCFLKEVIRRGQNTWIPEYIEPGTMIITDSWVLQIDS